jgi:hypothetical protein
VHQRHPSTPPEEQPPLAEAKSARDLHNAAAMKHGWRLFYAAAAAGVCVLVGAVSVSQARRFASQDALQKELIEATARWAVVSAQQREAETARGRLAAVLELEARISAELSAPKWTDALRALADSDSLGTTVTEISARERTGEPNAAELSISGVSEGVLPRVAAERFRSSVLGGLEKLALPGAVTAEFASVKELTESGPTPRQQCVFTIAATFKAFPPTALARRFEAAAAFER